MRTLDREATETTNDISVTHKCQALSYNDVCEGYNGLLSKEGLR